MKKAKLRKKCLFIILFYISTVCGCATSITEESVAKSDIIVQEKREYSEKELGFIKEYEKLSEGNVKVEEIELPSDDPRRFDFAIIPLEEKSFHVPAFSFLPIDNRNLTNLELVQLFHYYGGIEAEKILESKASMKRNSEQRANRELSDAEQFLLRYEVQEKYLNQGQRSTEKFSTDGKSGNPFYTMISEAERFWFYPTEELTTEQLLQIVDSMYREVPKEWYTPSEDEFSVNDIEKEVKNKIKEYILTNKKMKKGYTFYSSEIPMNAGRPESMKKFESCFEISVNMKNGDYDYAFTLAAKDGSLMKWKRYPKDYFSKENYSADRRKLDSLANKEQDKLLTEEQLKGIAIKYAKKVLLPKEELVTKKILVEEEQNKELNYRKVTIYEANKEYDIFINKEDGEVCGLEVK